MDGQDWKPVVLRGKCDAGKCAVAPKSYSEKAVAMAKLEAAEGPLRTKELTQESLQAILTYRRVNNLTQKQLDSLCSFPANTINHIEARRQTPTASQLQTLGRVLKTGLKLQ